MAKKLPKTIYVAWRGESDPFLGADTTQKGALEDDGPTIVGTYQLIEQHEVRKVIEAKPKRG
jgi:hypothetical protein